MNHLRVIQNYWQLFALWGAALFLLQPTFGNPQDEVAEKWKTMGFQQPNSMGGGEAAIPETGTFRVFILMGQSNMNGSGLAKEPGSALQSKARAHSNMGQWTMGISGAEQ